MTKNKSAVVTGVVVTTLALACFAKTPTLTGKMVAYDPILHAAKDASFVANKEVVIVEVPGPKIKYVKVVFVSFGTTQVDPKYFDGATPLSAQALRDRACDESSPRIATEISLKQPAGTYLLTDAFKNSPPANLKKLECYDATGKK